MSKIILAAFGLAATAALSPLAAAADIVSPGSSYSIYLKGETSGAEFNSAATFDGLAESLSRAGLALTLTESQADLGGGIYRITVNVSANGDLFPSLGEGSIEGIGIFGDGFDLLQPAYLDDARIKLYTPAGLLFTTSNLADDYRSELFSGLWDGTFTNGSAFINPGAGGRGINGVGFEFQVTAIPEPEITLLLGAGMGFFGFIARRRRLARCQVPVAA
jgi:hypothetical protein